MNDAEISRRLALAIGYKRKHVTKNLDGGISVCRRGSPQGFPLPGWYRFDYRDPAVIWPIAERFDCFPMKIESGWRVWSGSCLTTAAAAKTVALAVIKHYERSKTA